MDIIKKPIKNFNNFFMKYTILNIKIKHIRGIAYISWFFKRHNFIRVIHYKIKDQFFKHYFLIYITNFLKVDKKIYLNKYDYYSNKLFSQYFRNYKVNFFNKKRIIFNKVWPFISHNTNYMKYSIQSFKKQIFNLNKYYIKIFNVYKINSKLVKKNIKKFSTSKFKKYTKNKTTVFSETYTFSRHKKDLFYNSDFNAWVRQQKWYNQSYINQGSYNRINTVIIKKELLYKNTSSKNKVKLAFKLKLKKKGRFWRLFKRFSLFTKNIKFFSKLKWWFNNIRILKKQYSTFYIFKNSIFLKSKYGFNKNYVTFLERLELRLQILLIRVRFCFNLHTSLFNIKTKKILVNGGIIIKSNYLVNILDLIQKRRIIGFFRKHLLSIYWLRMKRIWRFRWRFNKRGYAKFLMWRDRRFNELNLYMIKRSSNILNYTDLIYRIPAFIILKQPFISEIIIKQQKKILQTFLLKKLYYLY